MPESPIPESLMPESPKFVLSRDSVIDCIADRFARQSTLDINQFVLPFGELRWTGWKLDITMTGLAGQLMLWIYDRAVEGREERMRDARYYAVTLPGGHAARYEKGDCFKVPERLHPEYMLDRDSLGATLAAEFRRGLHELVDAVMSDAPEIVARLLWRGPEGWAAPKPEGKRWTPTSENAKSQ